MVRLCPVVFMHMGVERTRNLLLALTVHATLLCSGTYCLLSNACAYTQASEGLQACTTCGSHFGRHECRQNRALAVCGARPPRPGGDDRPDPQGATPVHCAALRGCIPALSMSASRLVGTRPGIASGLQSGCTGCYLVSVCRWFTCVPLVHVNSSCPTLCRY